MISSCRVTSYLTEGLFKSNKLGEKHRADFDLLIAGPVKVFLAGYDKTLHKAFITAFKPIVDCAFAAGQRLSQVAHGGSNGESWAHNRGGAGIVEHAIKWSEGFDTDNVESCLTTAKTAAHLSSMCVFFRSPCDY